MSAAMQPINGKRPWRAPCIVEVPMTPAEAADVQMIDRVTILTTLSKAVATKRIRLRPGKPPEIIEFDKPKFFQAFEREVDGLASLAALLAKIERHPRAMVVRGQLLSGVNPQRVRRLRYARNGADGDPCFEDVPRYWVLLDFDTIACNFDPCSDPEECVRIAARLLPPAFHGVSCWWQFTGGAGIKPGIRMRLGYWLDHPLGERDLKRWLPGKPVDQSVLSPVQPIYVSWPIFEEGATRCRPLRHLPRLSRRSRFRRSWTPRATARATSAA
jgi:hypothetical protein